MVNVFRLSLVTFSDISNFQIGFQNPSTGIMMGIVDLHNHIFFFLIIVFIFVCWMLYVVCEISIHPLCDIDLINNKLFSRLMFNKQKLNFFYDKNITHNSVLEIIWTIVPSIILFFIAVPSFALLYATDQVIFPELTLKVIGHQWYWSYEYGDNFDFTSYIAEHNSIWHIIDDFFSDVGIAQNFGFDSYLLTEQIENRALPFNYLLDTDKIVVLPIDTNIRILVTSSDVIHSWAMPAFGIKVDAVPGRLNEVFLNALRPGIFYGQCSEICGTGHGFMPICVAIVSKKDFLNWILYMRHFDAGWNVLEMPLSKLMIDLIKSEDFIVFRWMSYYNIKL